MYNLLNQTPFLELLFILLSPLLPAILAQPHITLKGSNIRSYFFGCYNLKNKVILSTASACFPPPFCGLNGHSCLRALPYALFYWTCTLHLLIYHLLSLSDFDFPVSQLVCDFFPFSFYFLTFPHQNKIKPRF